MNAEQILTPVEIQELKKKGLSDEDIQRNINEAVEEQGDVTGLDKSYQMSIQRQSKDPLASASNSFIGNGRQNENLIEWQLELDSILERAEHFLRGDNPVYQEGCIIWKRPEKGKEILSNYGVSECMRILLLYVNRNTILSNYSEDIINTKMYDLGMEVTDLFYMKYEEMGLTNLNKRKMYPMIVRQIVDIVHSTYLRSLNGGERESLREARSVVQSENNNIGGFPGVNINTGQGQKQRGVLNPLRYIKGKYT